MNESLKNRFKKVFTTNLWGSRESRSGKGSELRQTELIIKQIPEIIKKYKICSILDAPCGDYNYMKEIKLQCKYIGIDIVSELIESNSLKYNSVDFRCLDITSDDLPRCDLVLVRDLFSHLSNDHIKCSIQNIKKSGAKFLLVTSYTDHKKNLDLGSGPDKQWRRINLEKEPFNLNVEAKYSDGGCPINKDKSLLLINI